MAAETQMNLDDLEAIVRYMSDAKATNPGAASIQDEFAKWYTNVGWYDKHFDTQNVVNHAKNLRTKFNRANTTSAEEASNVERVIQGGLRTEQVIEDMPPQARDSSGLLGEEKKPLIPHPYDYIAVGAAGVTVAAVALKKLHLI